jgi:hypothetical protein
MGFMTPVPERHCVERFPFGSRYIYRCGSVSRCWQVLSSLTNGGRVNVYV